MLFGKHVNKYYLKYFFSFFIGVVSLIVVDIAQIYIPIYLGEAIDNMNNHVPSSTYLSEMLINLVIVAFAIFIGRFVWRIAFLGTATKIQQHLRGEIFNKITTLSRKYFHNNRVGELLSLLTYDVEAIQDVFGFGMISLVDCLFLGTMTLIQMFILDWRLTLMSLIPLLLIGILSGAIEKGLSSRYAKRQKTLDNLSNFAQENFSGIRVIKAFVQERYEKMIAHKLGMDCKNADVSLSKFSSGVDALITFLCNTIMFVLLSGGGYFVYLTASGAEVIPLTVGDITKFVGYFNLLVWPMLAIGHVIVMTSKGSTSLKRISKLLDLEEDIIDGELTFENPVLGDIEIKNLTFTYPDASSPSLKNITLKINKGEKIGIVGRVGSGKSTLMDILMRLYNVEKGTVFIDNIDIMNLKVKDVRNIIGYVPQDSFLFSDKVKNNISFVQEEMPMDKIIEAAKFSSVHDNILKFDNGYDTITGEKGVSLSGGQKQRIAISRAYIKDAPILIMDDSVSAVDMKTEQTILNNINELRKDKTTILIASRVSTICHLDRILVLKDGQIEGFAPHDELLKISKTYAHMVKIQKFEEEMEGDRYES